LYSHYLRVREEGFGDEMKRRIMIGAYALSAGYYDAYYLKAQKVRTLVCEDFKKAFEEVDVIITPTTPSTAFTIGQNSADPVKMYLEDVFTVSINIAGLPALALPCGFSKNNLPIGMQIIGPQFAEPLLLKTGHIYQNSTDWHKKKPQM
ncbi:MAG: amidase, partial [Candidatus Gracilibacteria bacterium]